MRPLLCLLAFAWVFAVDTIGFENEAPLFLQPISLTGAIFSKSSSNSPALFSFRRTAHLEGSSIIASREYFAPDGILAARESVQYEREQLKRFTLEEIQINARGSATFETTADGRTLIRFEYETGFETKRKQVST